MSAFVGVVNFDGAPVDTEFLRNSADYLGRIAPDTQHVRVSAQAGFAQALLHTTTTPQSDPPPCFLDDQTTLVGNVRLDGRDDLIRKLGAHQESRLGSVSDEKLVLLSWAKWQDSLTQHILGDFSFAIWDPQSRQLFAARDQMGTRTFYYHLAANRLIYSNALNAILRYPGLDRCLDRETVGDFLLFGYSIDENITSYRHVKQLGPAQQAVFREGKSKVKRYWSLPTEEPMRFLSDEDCLSQFDELLTRAVSDRTNNGDIGILISAGMDSPSITVKTKSIAEQAGIHRNIHLTTFKQRDIPEVIEHQLAEQLAGQLGLNIEISEPEDSVFARHSDTGWPAPEMMWHQSTNSLYSSLKSMASKAPVALTGQGGDSVFYRNQFQLAKLLRQGRLISFITEVRRFYQLHGQRPPFGIRTRIKNHFEPEIFPGVPAWLNKDFVTDHNLEDRLADRIRSHTVLDSNCHPSRPEAFRQLKSPIWQYALPAHDPQATGVPIEFRHPFLDIRLIRFLLRIDSPRWFHRKAIIRCLMKGSLPSFVIDRSKHILDFSYSRRKLLDATPQLWHSHTMEMDDLAEFINIKKYLQLTENVSALPPIEAMQLRLPIVFSSWYHIAAEKLGGLKLRK